MVPKKKIKRIALLLLFLLWVQACTVYKKGNFTLADASELNTRSKIEYTDGTKVKFKEITQSNTGIYYDLKTEKY